MSSFELSLFVLMLYSDTLLSFNSNAHTQADTRIPRILGGFDCTINAHPYLVALVHKSNEETPYCTGTLISWSWVLTAAHCFGDGEGHRGITNYGDHSIIAGRTMRKADADEGAQKIPFKNIYVHPSFDFSTTKNDVAVVQVTENFTETPFVTLARMPPRPTKTVDMDTEPECKMGLAVGWGDRNVKKRGQNMTSALTIYPQCVHLPLIKLSDCKRLYEERGLDGSVMTVQVLCTFDAPGGRSFCEGDGGGPLFCADDPGRIIGIISSFTGERGLPNGPRHYMSVSEYLTFIRSTVNCACVGNAAVTIEFECHYYCYILLLPVILSFIVNQLN